MVVIVTSVCYYAPMKEALLWEKLGGSKVKCSLCGHRCTIAQGEYGICGVRRNVDGILKSLSYGRLISTAVDPIEKKPLFHFQPGSISVSIAAAGCNFRCGFCQNYSISQIRKEGILTSGDEVSTEYVVEAAREGGHKSISYTYTEPTVNFEFVLECSKLAADFGISNVWVTNGFMTPEAIETIAPYMDAANVDLKAFSEKTYKEIMGGELKVVLDAIKLLKKKGVWIEITTLIVPDMNDSGDEIGKIAQFIYDVDPDIPWHVSRYHADYKYESRQDSTPVETLNKAADIGYEVGLRYIYCGNVWGVTGEHTYCHSCKELLVERYGFTIRKSKITMGNCYNCGTKIPGVWS